MLGFLPTLHEDELLYSWLARYHLYSLNNGPKQTMIDLFGIATHLAVPDLPVNLEILGQRVRPFMGDQVDEWIKNHTFFRFNTAFVLPAIRNKTKSSMVSATGNSALHMLTGFMASGVKEKDVFYYCTKCVNEDLKVRGESYWRLTHQLPGVLLCTKHRCELSRSHVPFRSLNRHEYVPATTENCRDRVAPSRFSIITKDHLLFLAQEVERLVLHDWTFDRLQLQETYRKLLGQHGFQSANGFIKQTKLAKQFRAFYGREFLQAVQSDFQINDESNWLRAITRKHRKSFHPIRHLLLIRFLGRTIESIFEDIVINQPFGNAPFPCLNRAADHYLSPVIEIVSVTICKETKRPIGSFTCTCGFIFTRKGPDTSEEDRMRIGRVTDYGRVWRKRLNHLVYSEKRSFRAVAKLLGVDTKTAIKYSRSSLFEKRHIGKADPELLESKKKEWKKLVTQNSKHSTTELRRLNPALYSWLYRNCPEWLKLHVPHKLKRSKGHLRIDWERRDKLLLQQMEQVIEEMRSSSPPERITKSGVAVRLRKRSFLEKLLPKLRKCQQLLDQSIETIEDFQMRRISWAIDQLRESGDEIVEWRVRRIAGINKNNSILANALKCLE